MRKHRLLLPLVAATLLSSPLASGGELMFEEDALGLVRNIGIVVRDDMPSGCWADKSEVIERVSQALRAEGIEVVQERLVTIPPFSANLILQTGGSRVGEECRGVVNVSLRRKTFQPFEGHLMELDAVLFSQTAGLYKQGPMDDLLSQAYGAAAKMLADMIARARERPMPASIIRRFKPQDMRPLTFREMSEAAGR